LRRPGLKSARSLVLDISPLRESVSFRALWLGQIISLVGTQMRIVAVSYQVFEITGSTVAVGLIGLAEVVPLIAFSLIGGSLADAIDRRRLMAIAQAVLLADSVALAIVSLSDEPSLGAIYALVGLGAAVEAIDKPARNAMIPSLVRTEKLAAAMALRQVVYQVTLIAGPAVGGLLIAVLDGRVAAVYLIDGLTFVGGLIALLWIPSISPQPGEGGSSATGVRSVVEGLAFVCRTPLILSIFVVDFVAMIFGMPRAVFPELAAETFDSGSAALGLLYAAPASGALVGALTTGWVSRVSRQGLAILASVTVWGGAIALAGLSLFSFSLTLLLLAVAGGADVVSAVFRGTILQQQTPDSLRGRANALNLMVVSGGPRLGDVEAGLMAGLVGAGPSVVIGGVACLAGTGLVATAIPSLRAYRAPAPDSERKDGVSTTSQAVD
jgi:MFS family permease